MADLEKMTAKRRENYAYLADAMRRLEWDLHNHIEATGRIPPEWHEIAQERTPKRKIKVTLALEEDVVKFFKSMGTGHGPRMNEVLRSFMHARLAGVVRGADTISYYKRRDGAHDGARPMWGETARMMGEDDLTVEEDRKAERRALVRGEALRRSLDR